MCCTPPKIKRKILARKDSQSIRATLGDYLASRNCKPMGKRDFLASMEMDQDFPGKETHWRHFLFFFLILFFFNLDRSVERQGRRHNDE